jgi:hypothetical protein
MASAMNPHRGIVADRPKNLVRLVGAQSLPDAVSWNARGGSFLRRALSRGLDQRLRSTLKAIRNEPSLLGQLKTVLLRLPDLFKPLLQTRHLGNSTSWARSCRVLRGGAALLRMPPMWRQGCADDDAQPCRRVLSLQGMWTPLA